ncbi:MAG: hypothetical protein ACUVWV_14830 [Thermodesulfobacteriota bacterium]
MLRKHEQRKFFRSKEISVKNEMGTSFWLTLNLCCACAPFDLR